MHNVPKRHAQELFFNQNQVKPNSNCGHLSNKTSVAQSRDSTFLGRTKLHKTQI